MAKVTNALGRTMEYSYDETGNLTQSKDYAGTITKYSYDGMDRMVKKTVGTDATEYSFDNGFGKTSYEYDLLDRVTRVVDRNGRATIG